MAGYYSQQEFDKRMKALEEVYKDRKNKLDFSLSNAIELKNYSNKPTTKFPSFTELAEEYIRQNKDNKPVLDAFKNMNPLSQRTEIANNLVGIFENSGERFFEPFNISETLGTKEKSRIKNLTTNNLLREINYLKDHATKQDLEYQRYKDIFDVPYWTNKAINDFLTTGDVPRGFEYSGEGGMIVPFDKGATEYGEFMTGFKFDPTFEGSVEDIENLFYNKVKKDYETKPFEDRFGKASLAERFANKQALSERPIEDKAIGGAARLLQFPYFNTIEQAKQAGAIQPTSYTLPPYEADFPFVGKTEIPFVGQSPVLNIGEVGFDAAMIGSPWIKLSKLLKVGKTANALNLGMLGEASLKGGLIGAKSTLEGEQKAVPTPINTLEGFGLGAGMGSAFYKLGKFVPKITNRGFIDEKVKNVSDELKEVGEYYNLQKQLNETQNVLKSIKTRENMFGKEGLSGINLYARNFREPTDIYSSKPNDILNQAIEMEKTHIVGNPVYFGAVDNSPYEVGFNINSPIQNTPRSKSVDFNTPQTIVSEATGYYPMAGVALGAESESRQALANLSKFYAKNPEYVEAMKMRGIDLTDESKSVENGIRIFNEMNAYLDEPVAEAVITKASGSKMDNLYNLWVNRNFPNGVKDEKAAKELFYDKFKTAQVNYEEGTLPENFSQGYIENTNIFKNVSKKVNHLSDKDKKKELNARLESLKSENTLKKISETLSEVSKQAGGVYSSPEKFAAEVRRELSPNLVRKQAFENVKSIKAAEKDVAELPQKIEKSKNLQNTKETLQEFKKGYSPLVGFLGNKITGVGAYAMSKGGTRILSDDENIMPVNPEQSNISAFKNGLVNYFYDSPLVRMRQKGSFNIPFKGE